MALFFRIILFISAVSTSALAADTPRPMSPIDFLEINRLSAPALSPDGSQLLYLRSHTDWKNNKAVSRLYILDTANGESRPALDVEDEEESHGRGVWAPDGSGFLTLLKRDGDDHKQAYFYSITSAELMRLTEQAEDVENLRWAPGSDAFYFSATRPDDEETRKLQKNKWLIRDYETRAPSEIWRFDRASEETNRIVAGDFYVRNWTLSQDGAKILHMRAPGGLDDDVHDGELWLLDIPSGETRQLTNNNYAEAQAQLSPDNSKFAYIATVNEDGAPYYEDNLFVQNVGEPKPRLLLPDEALEVLDFEWRADGDGLFLLGNIGVRTELFYYDLQTDSLERLTTGDHVVENWTYAPHSGAHTAKIVTAENPGEIYAMNDVNIGFAPLTHEYDDWDKQFRLPKQEAVTWRGRGRTQVEGLLVYPLDYDGEAPFPLVTITHGGPRSSSQFGSWNTSRYVPVLAAQGYGVLLPNHRGGTGYGDDFMRDMVGDYFANSHHDVLDGVEAMVDRGIADPDQLIKMGWSAGGHMTNKIITVTSRFKAASSGAGASDWVSMYGESDIRHNRTPWFGGAPWEKKAPIKNYRRQSLIQDAWKTTTPTLFFVGEKDVRVPPTQSILMYRGLKAASVETRLYIAPGEPHGYGKPSHRLFKINTELEWFARHLSRAPYERILPDEALNDDKSDEEDAPDCATKQNDLSTKENPLTCGDGK